MSEEEPYFHKPDLGWSNAEFREWGTNKYEPRSVTVALLSSGALVVSIHNEPIAVLRNYLIDCDLFTLIQKARDEYKPTPYTPPRKTPIPVSLFGESTEDLIASLNLKI